MILVHATNKKELEREENFYGRDIVERDGFIRCDELKNYKDYVEITNKENNILLLIETFYFDDTPASFDGHIGGVRVEGVIPKNSIEKIVDIKTDKNGRYVDEEDIEEYLNQLKKWLILVINLFYMV